MAFDVSSFQQDVIERSRSVPVLVDFWAPWCGPCRVIGPVLEKLAAESAGRWVLAKVNTDENPELSMQYGIRGIPAVKLFADGEVIDEFTGALPEYAVRQWLDEALPSENRLRVEQAEALLEAGDDAASEALLRLVVDEEPGNAPARLLLAGLRVFADPDEALDLIEPASGEPALLQVEEAVRTVARLLHLYATPDALPDAPVRSTYLDALDALHRQDFDAALTAFITVIQQDRYYDDDGSRKACIALFTLLGPQHPITRKHRRTFDMWLY